MESKLERRILKTQAKREQLDVITRPTCQRLTLSSNPRLTPVNRSCCWCVQVFAYLARAAIEQKRATVLLSLSLILSAYVAAFASAQAADRQSSPNGRPTKRSSNHVKVRSPFHGRRLLYVTALANLRDNREFLYSLIVVSIHEHPST